MREKTRVLVQNQNHGEENHGIRAMEKEPMVLVQNLEEENRSAHTILKPWGAKPQHSHIRIMDKKTNGACTISKSEEENRGTRTISNYGVENHSTRTTLKS